MNHFIHLRPLAHGQPGMVCGLKFDDTLFSMPFRAADSWASCFPTAERCPKCWAVWDALKADGVDLDVRPTVPIAGA